MKAVDEEDELTSSSLISHLSPSEQHWSRDSRPDGSSRSPEHLSPLSSRPVPPNAGRNLSWFYFPGKLFVTNFLCGSSRMCKWGLPTDDRKWMIWECLCVGKERKIDGTGMKRERNRAGADRKRWILTKPELVLLLRDPELLALSRVLGLFSGSSHTDRRRDINLIRETAVPPLPLSHCVMGFVICITLQWLVEKHALKKRASSSMINMIFLLYVKNGLLLQVWQSAFTRLSHVHTKSEKLSGMVYVFA